MMKDELSAETLYQQSIDFAKSKQLRQGEADNSQVALAATTTSTSTTAAQASQMPCANCNHPFHCQRECFKDGGGLSHLSHEERQDWLELKRRRRARIHGDDIPPSKRQRADDGTRDGS